MYIEGCKIFCYQADGYVGFQKIVSGIHESTSVCIKFILGGSENCLGSITAWHTIYIYFYCFFTKMHLTLFLHMPRSVADLAELNTCVVFCCPGFLDALVPILEIGAAGTGEAILVGMLFRHLPPTHTPLFRPLNLEIFPASRGCENTLLMVQVLCL